MMRRALNPNDQMLLSCVAANLPGNTREIAAALDYPHSTMLHALQRLERRGYLSHTEDLDKHGRLLERIWRTHEDND